MSERTNILLLGETGVGKSTLINGLANYLKYSTLTEALDNDAVFHIPPSFTLTDDNYAEHKIVLAVGNDDENEILITGESATQFPRSYQFNVDGVTVNLIDTPGIGDTRGFEQDTLNMSNILDHIASMDVIHGICILLQPSNARLTVLFRFCINELLVHLHREAVQNIVFCFTNSHASYYKPGDTLPSLRRLLNEYDVKIDLSNETIYCIDNEAIRYLAAVKSHSTFKPQLGASFVESWIQTTTELKRLVRHVASLPAHPVSSILTVNKARRMILALNLPLADIASTIQQNLVKIEEEKVKLSELIECSDMLRKNLYRPDFSLIEKRLVPLVPPYPTVCTSARCVFVIGEGDITKFDYRCHNYCHTALDSLARSVAFVMLDVCHGCGCPWTYHQKIKYKLETIEKKVVDFDIHDKVTEKQSDIDEIKKCLRKLTDESRTCEEEKKKLSVANHKFTSFVKMNAVAAYNKTVEEYLVYSLNNRQGGQTAETIKIVNRRSQDDKAILDSALKNVDDFDTPVSAQEIMELIHSLYALPVAGPIVAQVMNSSTG